MANAKQGWTFAQVPIWSACDPRLSDGAFRLFAYLVWRQGTNPDAWPGIPTMAADLGVSDETIRRRISELDSAGYTNITRRSGHSNRYAMIADPDNASSLYTPHKSEGGRTTVVPPPNLGGDPPQICEGTPPKSGGYNDTHEPDSKNKTGAAAPPAPDLEDLPYEPPVTLSFDELFPGGDKPPLAGGVKPRDLQTQDGRDRALVRMFKQSIERVEAAPWLDLEAVSPVIASYQPPVAVDRDFVLHLFSTLVEAGIPLDLTDRSEVRYWLKGAESIGRKSGWDWNVAELALQAALQSGLSLKGPQSMEYAIADVLRARTQKSSQPLAAGGDGGMVTVLRKVEGSR